jgi:heptosyltransferase-2
MNIEELKIPECKKFSGYKPCESYKNCLENGCQKDDDNNKMGVKILIISLDALGNVIDNTPILPALKRKHPISTIYWLTMPNAEKILFNSKYIDKLYLWTDESRMILRNMNFDFLLNGDKSVYACAFASEIKANKKYGFLLNSDGKIIPANQNAMYCYLLGNNDELKFRKNKRTGIEILHEVFDLKYERDECEYNFTEEERTFIEGYKKNIGYKNNKYYIGLNTGCSDLFPNKKMTVEQHILLIKKLLKKKDIIIVLLGGREDTERNKKIYSTFTGEKKKRIINTPTTEGIRRGACYMEIPDVVISGDSFGLHLAIALKKFVISWYGLSCWTEIEDYGRGVKLIPEGLECAPCWKRVCPYDLECIKMINLDMMVDEVNNYINKNQK